MQNQRSENKVCEGALVRNVLEVDLVLRVGLDAKGGCKDELANGCAEACEEGVEGLENCRSAIVQ